MRVLRSSLVLLLLAGCSSDPEPEPLGPIDYVDPLIGTGGGGFAQAQAFVGPTVPFGMVKPGPDTTGPLMNNLGFAHTSGYWHYDDTIEGFSQMHLHGVGVEDFGNILLMPTIGMSDEKTSESGYQQKFRHKRETVTPGYYGVKLDVSNIEVELTAATHAAFHRYTFPAKTTEPVLIIDVGHGIGRTGSLDGEVTIDQSSYEISGWMSNAGRFTSEGRAFNVYFSAKLSEEPASFGVWENSDLFPGEQTKRGIRIGAYLHFPSGQEQLEVRIGISLIDVDQARKNRATIDNLSFDETHEAARAAWADALGAIEVKGGTDAQKRMFYTGIYHSMLMPTLYTEADGRYVGLDRNVHTASGSRYYSDFSGWDTYRTLHPLLSLIAPDRQREMNWSLLAMAEQTGVLPRWPLAVNRTGVMIGSPAAIILADSHFRGVDGFDLATAYEVMVADADAVADRTIRGEMPICIQAGYCPADQVGSSVSKTQEYAWADFAIANLAEALGHTDDAARFRQRSRFFVPLFDSDTQFFRGKNADGTWSEDNFDPDRSHDDYTEGNAWHYLWATPFDLTQLIALFGGRDQMLQKLDHFFELSEATPTPVLGIEPLMGMDTYYWHGNEPDLHASYMYALAGVPSHGMKWVDWVRDVKYDDTPDGIPGNDDAGTLSAWYVFSAMGLYPLAGSPYYIVGTPLFEEVVIHLKDGDFRIKANGVSDENRYIQSATLNGQSVSRPLIKHEEIKNGGELIFEMGALPTNWGETDPFGPPAN